MPQTLNALIYPHAPTVVAERRMIDPATIPPNKAAWWRPVVAVENVAFNPATHRKTGPVPTIEPTRVLDTYTISALTAQQISDAKDAAVNGLGGGIYQPLLEILLIVVNDARATRGKLNALIDATAMAGTVPKYPNNQTTQIDMGQLRQAIKAALT